jgi:hypothetical protein
MSHVACCTTRWIESIGKLAEGTYEGEDRNYNIIDVRDLVSAHRLAMESTVDHLNTHGGPRYVRELCN